jgi:hypothetical protein
MYILATSAALENFSVLQRNPFGKSLRTYRDSVTGALFRRMSFSGNREKDQAD